MGSIKKIFPVSDWKIKNKNKSKLIDNDIIYNVIIGECDDEIDFSEITYYFSENIYQDILNKKIQVKKFPYSENPILLIDENRNIIPPINGLNSDMEKIDNERMEYVRTLKIR